MESGITRFKFVWAVGRLIRLQTFHWFPIQLSRSVYHAIQSSLLFGMAQNLSTVRWRKRQETMLGKVSSVDFAFIANQVIIIIIVISLEISNREHDMGIYVHRKSVKRKEYPQHLVLTSEGSSTNETPRSVRK